LACGRTAIKAKDGVRALLGVLLKAPNEEAPICEVATGLLAALADPAPDLASQVPQPAPRWSCPLLTLSH
jgi:hypothetical protein